MTETWAQVITIVGANLIIMLTFFGVSISLHNGLRTDLNEHRKEANEILKGIQEEVKGIQSEMKDFHGKMEKIDSDFKNHILYLHEEREKTKK